LLKIISQSELHHPWSSLDGGDTTKFHGRSAEVWVDLQSVTRSTNVRPRQPLGVGGIKNLPAKLQRMTFNWKVEGLCQSEIEPDIPRLPEDVPFSGLPGARISKTLIRGSWVCEKVGMRSRLRCAASTGRIRVPWLWTSQFVAQISASKAALTGRPEFHRKIPVSCQPPRKASAAGCRVCR
jgi:hypothetical protein